MLFIGGGYANLIGVKKLEAIAVEFANSSAPRWWEGTG